MACGGLATEKKMLIVASAVQFAKFAGHEASNEEECYFGSSPNTTAIDSFWTAGVRAS